MKDKLLQIIVGVYLWVFIAVTIIFDDYLAFSALETGLVVCAISAFTLYVLVIRIKLVAAVFMMVILGVGLSVMAVLAIWASLEGFENIVYFRGERFLTAHAVLALFYSVIVVLILRTLQDLVMVVFRVPRNKRPGNDNDEYAKKFVDVVGRIHILSPEPITSRAIVVLVLVVGVPVIIWHFFISPG